MISNHLKSLQMTCIDWNWLKIILNSDHFRLNSGQINASKIKLSSPSIRYLYLTTSEFSSIKLCRIPWFNLPKSSEYTKKEIYSNSINFRCLNLHFRYTNLNSLQFTRIYFILVEFIEILCNLYNIFIYCSVNSNYKSPTCNS